MPSDKVAEFVSVLVVDDSALMRNLVSRIIETTPGLKVADKAMNGVFALQKIPRCNPDVIVLDIEMPEMNGIEFLKERQRLGIEIPVIILSSVAQKGARITMEALSLGAADFITKPSGSISSDIHTVAGELGRMVLAYGSQYQRQRGREPPRYHFETPERLFELPVFEPRRTVVEAPKITPLRSPAPTEIIAIGISTGGPNALRDMLAKVDPDLQQPIVIVQHMPAGFTEEFAASLNRICPLDVKEAAEGDVLRPGRVLVAPGDYHITVEKRSLAAVVHTNQAEPENGHRPSADVLFRSVAQHYGNRSLAVIMTGMGKDGAREIGSIFREGGITLGQDEASCIVYGMPKVAFELGYLMEQVPLSRMPERICQLAKEGRR
ncbi:MAG: chemotaxis response regulator protein-glutamate methylesterase [Spirochaetes bacterium GWD1_61_31]|nr:MAG: chemotaxis response regulator protein-glutamate methylesterase [Spirochaetes bacterium GWB1_60_80]OHD29757.1 MAG: chemotaxis response regulator protein-glutamate methylesterase [Spirochaetes bacterium GWC1_61_12]OHD42901.1 MAG: chemotaxis response regulator protein-glutamate methylesterase [Spirochaetes bacterium GWE1_60_18]OHD43479.1 MAG: chemotaxis response regulator protein-glutamate methylesterase [Spirochaetes bacterium GWD1_61_31]OHD59560.1 MAG: chemotaxis response regulator prote